MRAASPNFSFLEKADACLYAQAVNAEKFCLNEPVYALSRLRLFAELLARNLAARFNVAFDERTTQNELLRELKYQNIIDARVSMLFHNIKNAGNLAVHEGKGGVVDALTCLRYAHLLAVYYYRIFYDRTFRAEPFFNPSPPDKIEEKLQKQLAEIACENEKLRKKLVDTARISAARQTRKTGQGTRCLIII